MRCLPRNVERALHQQWAVALCEQASCARGLFDRALDGTADIGTRAPPGGASSTSVSSVTSVVAFRAAHYLSRRLDSIAQASYH
jgi:hypothetical protein